MDETDEQHAFEEEVEPSDEIEPTEAESIVEEAVATREEEEQS